MKTTPLFHRISAAPFPPIIAVLASAVSTGLEGHVWRISRGSGLAAVLCCLVNPLMAAQFGKFTYADNGTSITIIDYPKDEVGAVEIPASIIGKPVAYISNGAFANCGRLTSVTIPDSVTSIESDAFSYCGRLASVSIGNGVTHIGLGAFRYCVKLTSVTIPDSVTSIENWAYQRCTNLIWVKMGKGVNSIADGAFRYCSSLEFIAVDSLNSSFSSASGVLFNKDQTLLIKCPEGKSGSCTVPASVNSIANRAFRNCNKLTGVTIPANVTSIGAGMFRGCDSLTRIAIPAGITSIGKDAFHGCHKLSDIIIPISVTSIGDQAFLSCGSLTNIAIPNSVIRIGAEAFRGCRGLTSITIPDSVTRIGDSAFLSCTNLASVAFLGNSPEVGANIFDGSSPGFTLYYLKERAGFTSPTWHGYMAEPLLVARELSVTAPSGLELTDGKTGVGFGPVDCGTHVVKIFTISNGGITELSGLAVTKTGANAKDYTVKAPLKATLTAGASTTFEVIFKPTAKGIRKAVIHIKSNDSNENPFDITLTGKGMGVALHSDAGLAAITMSMPGISAKSNAGISSVASALRIDGNKYRCITLFRNGNACPGQDSVEVSSNLVDWFSGPNHTSVIEDNAEFLKVRDNTPIEPGKKRFIRANGSQRRVAPIATPAFSSSNLSQQ